MPLISLFENGHLQINLSAFTVLAPGSHLLVDVTVTANTDCQLLAMEWLPPSPLGLQLDPTTSQWPLALNAAQQWQGSFRFEAPHQQEGFGWNRFTLDYNVVGTSDPLRLAGRSWVSVFAPALAPYPAPLDDALRRRLIEVTNADLINGNCFLANSMAYLQQYCHIDVDPQAVPDILAQIPFSTDGLPLSDELYNEARLGKLSFSGIDEFTLYGEEECEASDSVFSAEGIKES